MKLAAVAGIETPPCGLFPLKDGSMAYLVLRFDRLATGRKLRQEDFCQLAEKSPDEKYEGSAELCARIVRRCASEPGIEVWKLYRLLLFNWWVGNGDAHLKNYSLLVGLDGVERLAPAYDLVATGLVTSDDSLALPVGGNKDRLTRRDWVAFADYCAIPRRAAERVIGEIVGAREQAEAIIGRSALPESMRADYRALVRSRAEILRS